LSGSCVRRIWQRRVVLFWIVLLVCNLVLVTNKVEASVDPDPPLYDSPPGPPFVPVAVNLPTGSMRQKFGIAAHPWWLDLYLDRFIAYYKDLGITSVRLPVEWKTLEPAPGQYNWNLNDRILNRLSSEGFEIIASFVTVPPWASTNPAECAKADITCGPKSDISTQARFSALAEAVVRHYPAVRYWEFWNEPEAWPKMGQRDISDYANWLRLFYLAAKRADPTVLVAATSLVGPEFFDWLYQYSDDNWGAANRPFDALAYHPYNHDRHKDKNGRELSLNKARVDQLRLMMVEKGDGGKPIWLTELGWETTQVSPGLAAEQLTDAFAFVDSRPYVTILTIHMLHDWTEERYGLMRTVPDVFYKGPLTPDLKFEPKQPYYNSYKYYNKRPLPSLTTDAPFDHTTVLVFPDTGHTVQGVFKTAWQRGSLTLFGYPRTSQFYEKNPSDNRFYLVQYFERVRMEYHPEYAGTSHEVLFGLLGNQLLYEHGWLNEKGDPIAGQALPEKVPATLNADTRWFPETSHAVTGLFLTAWQQQGGLAVVGLPKTDVFEELNPDDGQRYLVQYFERTRMELHFPPGTAGYNDSPYISFGLLGNQRLRLQNRLDQSNQPVNSNYYNPTLVEFRD